MSATKKTRVIKAKPPKREAPDDVPQFFRLNVEVGDLDAATSFYTKLLGVQGRKQPGHRCYFDCGRNPASAGCFLGEPAASSGKVLVLYGQESRGSIRSRPSAELSVARGSSRCTGRRHRGAPLGRTIVLCRGSLGKSSLFGRRGNRLHRVATPALHTGPFRRNK